MASLSTASSSARSYAVGETALTVSSTIAHGSVDDTPEFPQLSAPLGSFSEAELSERTTQLWSSSSDASLMQSLLVSSLGSEDGCVPDGPWCWENFDFPNQIPWYVDNTVLVASGSCAYGAPFPSGRLHPLPPQPEAAQWAEMLQRGYDPTSLREVWLQALDQHEVTSPGFMADVLYASVYARDPVRAGKITGMFLEYHLDEPQMIREMLQTPSWLDLRIGHAQWHLDHVDVPGVEFPSLTSNVPFK